MALLDQAPASHNIDKFLIHKFLTKGSCQEPFIISCLQEQLRNLHISSISCLIRSTAAAMVMVSLLIVSQQAATNWLLWRSQSPIFTWMGTPCQLANTCMYHKTSLIYTHTASQWGNHIFHKHMFMNVPETLNHAPTAYHRRIKISYYNRLGQEKNRGKKWVKKS